MRPRDDGIVIRRATLGDVGFIRRLALESAAYSIPEGRDISVDMVRARAREALRNLEILVHRRREAAILVAVDAEEEGRPVGYLILEFNHVEETTGETQSHIYDLAVEQDHMGRFVPHRLCWEAARISHEHGYRYMSGTVSATNQRALMTALKMGFDVERIGIVMACGPEGPARMPGRPVRERAHEINRSVRRQQRRNAIAQEQESTR